VLRGLPQAADPPRTGWAVRSVSGDGKTGAGRERWEPLVKTPPRVGSFVVSGILCSCGGRLEEASAKTYRCQGPECPHRGQDVVVIGMQRVLIYPAGGRGWPPQPRQEGPSSPAHAHSNGAECTISPEARG
jgi:hypothetical protein